MFSKDAMETISEKAIELVEEKKEEILEKVIEQLESKKEDVEKKVDEAETIVEQTAEAIGDKLEQIVDKLDDIPQVAKAIEVLDDVIGNQIDGREVTCSCFSWLFVLRITRKNPPTAPSKPAETENKPSSQ